MIHFCACTKSSRSPLENPKSCDKFCKSCGGRLPVDGPGAQSVSMLRTVGLELSRAIDPHLTWKTATNRRQRAVRRARTTFASANRKKAPSRSSKEREDLIDNDTKSTGDMPVSESEKLGVSILGRRFSENIESVPIKKRRFLLVQSPSPPRHALSHSVGVLDDQDASYQHALSSQNNYLHDIKSGYKGSNSAGGRSDLEEVNEKSCGAADFSGISILAAAACDDDVGGDSVTSEASVSKEYSSGGQDIPLSSPKLHLLTDKTEELFSCASEGLVGRTESTGSPVELPAASVLPSKESNDIKSDGSCNLGMSMNSLQKVPKKMTESASRDVRFHWDLNTVMDVWESNDDEALNSEQQSTNGGVEAGCNENSGNAETCQGQVGFEDTKSVSEPVVSQVHFVGEGKGICASESIKLEVPGISCDYSTAGDKESKTCSSTKHVDVFAKVGLQPQVPKATMADVSAEINPSQNASDFCTISGNIPSSVGGAVVSLQDSSLFSASLLVEEKADLHYKNCSSEVETAHSSSYLVSCEKSVEPTTNAFEPSRGDGQGIIAALSVENTNAAFVAEQENRADNCCLSDFQIEQVTHMRGHQGEGQASLCINSGTVRTDLQSLGGQIAESTHSLLVDGNICSSVVTTGVTTSDNVIVGWQKQTDFDVDKTKGGDASSCDVELKTADPEVKVAAMATDKKVDEVAADEISAEMKVDTSSETKVDVEINGEKCDLMSGENLNDAKIEFPDHTESVTLVDKSTSITLGSANEPPENGALSSQRICSNNKDGYASNPGQLALEDHLDCNYDSDASQNDADQTIGMEKVEFLGDDDSQYEDGEFRQSGVGCWLEEGVEEGETEHVDYESDRETYIYEGASSLPNSVNPQLDNEVSSDTSLGIPYRAHVRKDSQHLVSPAVLNCPLTEDALDPGFGKKNAGSVTEKGLRGHVLTEDGCKQLMGDIKNASNFKAADNKVTGSDGFLNGGEGARDLSHLTSSRMKMSGWDQLPEGCRSSVRNHNGTSLDTTFSSESGGRAVGSSMRLLSSRMEKQQASDGSHRNDKSYIRTTRSTGHSDFNSQMEGDAGATRSIGRSRSSLQFQGRGRGDRWLDPLKPHGNGRHDSSGYYGPASLSHPGSRNAAAAAVAKVESNGFVVAPDGTIVKASAAGSSGRLARGSAKTPSRTTHRSPMGRGSLIERDRPYGTPPGRGCSRELSPDTSMQVGRGRASRYGAGMVSLGHQESYRGPTSDNIAGSPSSINRPMSRSERSFSPHRRPFRISRSRSRSPSISRTRSPPRWTSPRGRNNGRINGGSAGLRRESKSPNFISEVTMDRPRPGLGECMIHYAQSSRNRASPPHSSRWVDGRKELPEHFRGHEYKRCSGRSPPQRVFSRGQRYDLMVSSVRPKAAEFYRPVNSGKFAEFVGFDRGSRNEGRGDDRRGHGERYEMPHSVRGFDDDGNMKRFQYDSEDGFRSHNSQLKPSEFQRGESPRAYDRKIDRQLGDSTWRFKEENRQFRKDRDGRHNASFKSFGVHKGDDHMDARRRRPS